MEYLRGDFDFHNTMIAYLPDEQIHQKITKKFAVYKKRQESFDIKNMKHSMNNLF